MGFVTRWKNPQPGIRDLPYVKGACESWARWCAGSRHGGGISMTGRLMQGVRANVCPGWVADMQAGRGHDPWCPDCHGTGRLLLRLTATQRKKVRVCPVCENESDPTGKSTPRRENCFRCHGEGRVTMINLKVNPAAIRGTRHVGGTVGDWQAIVLDDLITGWRESDSTFWMNRAIIREYFFNGTQQMKARQLQVSLSFFEKTLRMAYVSIDETLFRERPSRSAAT